MDNHTEELESSSKYKITHVLNHNFSPTVQTVGYLRVVVIHHHLVNRVALNEEVYCSQSPQMLPLYRLKNAF